MDKKKRKKETKEPGEPGEPSESSLFFFSNGNKAAIVI